ncbi:DUF3866 family protein [Cryptosporangium sp. NPDC048952]|uniref:DUF3866 family protein n=1 Tax=Cryptosporangium sp. NPDC048952 TaxID=3363961 RepID=UPI0037159FA7
MIRWRRGVVSSVGRAWAGALELSVSVEGAPVRALAYPAMVGTPVEGDAVLLNTTALSLGLGTGGYALVIALPDRLPPDPDVVAGPGHMVKARYTPGQVTVLGVDEQDSPHHVVLASDASLDGMPVVVADLHSALPAILAGVGPGPRVVYVMTDGGALPLWFSRAVATLRDASLLVGTVTVGQAFGGDLEAVTLHTGLLAARHVLSADVAIVAQGPGNLGTGTPWGFSGVAVGEAVNAISVLEGRPIGSLRISSGDARERHLGISHHSLTAYGRVALAPADLVVPSPLPSSLEDRVEEQLAGLPDRHRLVRVPTHDLDGALRALPLRLSSMGRPLDEDRIYFESAAAAGRHAASLV